jgi:hypothetical protein
MKTAFKFGVAVLLLLVLATPIMACLVPAAAMSAEERECCKRMAEECGKMGMPQSHSCCQTTTVPDHLAAIKSCSDGNSIHLSLVLAYAIDLTLKTPTVPESGSAPWAADIHSPPISPPGTILRI